MKTKFTLLLLFAFLFMACPGSGPIIDPPDPPIDPIQYVYMDTCIDSLEMRNTYCPDDRIEFNKKYVTGTEPSTWCSFHKAPDPPYPYPPIIEDIHAGFLGFNLWFYANAWNPEDEAAIIAQAKLTFHEIRARGIGVVDWFLWLSDGDPEHAHLNTKTPYLVVGNSFDLSKWTPRFWELFRIFIQLHEDFGLDPEPNIFMDRYCYGPFENNINGVNDFWSVEAYIYQKALSEKACQIMKDVFGDDYDPTIKPLNEGAHYGNIDQFHVLGQWHRDLWNDVFSKYTTIERMVFDVSMSEGVQIYENEILLCGKPYIPGEKHGNPEHDRADITLSILAETHSVATKANLIGNEKLEYLGSKWRRYKFHGDGSDSGTGFHVPGTDFKQGTPAETYDMGFYLWTKAKAANKQAVYSIFPMESFRDDNGNWNLWFENYKVNNIDWSRIDSLVQAHKDVYDN